MPRSKLALLRQIGPPVLSKDISTHNVEKKNILQGECKGVMSEALYCPISSLYFKLVLKIKLSCKKQVVFLFVCFFFFVCLFAFGMFRIYIRLSGQLPFSLGCLSVYVLKQTTNWFVCNHGNHSEV